MSCLNTLRKATLGAGVGVTFITALPVFGAAGAITAAGIAVGSVVGAAGGVLDSFCGD